MTCKISRGERGREAGISFGCWVLTFLHSPSVFLAFPRLLHRSRSCRFQECFQGFSFSFINESALEELNGCSRSFKILQVHFHDTCGVFCCMRSQNICVFRIKAVVLSRILLLQKSKNGSSKSFKSLQVYFHDTSGVFAA